MSGDPQVPILSDQPLTPEYPPRPTYARRIQRAKELADQNPAARDVLNYYARLAFHQEPIYESCLSCAEGNVAEVLEMTIDVALPEFPEFARSLAEFAPEALRQRAAALARAEFAELHELLLTIVNHDSTVWPAGDLFIALAFVQPLAERLGEQEVVPPGKSQATCPVCASEPICEVLRDRGHGAGRSLICSLCMQEWGFLRVACPACGEDRFESLPIFTPEGTHVRVDACDTCHHYLKAIDMTKDGFAVPVVDELAAVSLDLWAAEKGYKKLTLNLAGL